MLLFPSKKQLCFLPDARRKTNANQEHLVGIGIFSFIIPNLTSTIYILERLYELSPLLISVSNEKDHQNG